MKLTPQRLEPTSLIRIAISAKAFEAIAKTLPFGSTGYERERLIWLGPNVVDRLRAMRGPGESYSDVILRLAAGSGQDGH